MRINAQGGRHVLPPIARCGNVHEYRFQRVVAFPITQPVHTLHDLQVAGRHG